MTLLAPYPGASEVIGDQRSFDNPSNVATSRRGRVRSNPSLRYGVEDVPPVRANAGKVSANGARSGKM
jgi:hypothetical protein